MPKKKLTPIPNQLVINRMKFENCWWETFKIDPEYDNLPKRLYFDLLFRLVEEGEVKRAVVLMGPRRVGKTVMMHHVIGELLKVKKVRENMICFINVENPLFLNISLDVLFEMARTSVGNLNPKGWYVFFDEIQYLDNWEVHLKVLVDSYPNAKFVVSGSAAAALRIKSAESGAGRFTEFMLPPLTFHEYLHLKGYTNIIQDSYIEWKQKQLPFFTTNNIESLNRHFVDYINYGGYPEVIFSPKIQADMSRYVKNDIIDKVLLRDLPSLYGIQNQQELNRFFTTLVYYTANEISLDSLAQTTGVNKNTLKKYLEYLEAAFLIKLITRIDESGKHFQRQVNYKVYLTNPSLRSALFSPLDANDEGMGHLVETAIFSQWLHRENRVPTYARWDKGEVDMVGLDPTTTKPIWTVEIKWSNAPVRNADQIKHMISFCQKNNLKNCFVTTLNIWDTKEIHGIKVIYVPASIYAFNVGFNTIQSHRFSG